jgi:hypothetical protein
MSRNKDYTNPSQTGKNPPADRVGDMTGQPPTNEATDRGRAAKLANMLEDLQFPATKEEIKDHLNKKSPSAGNRSNDVMENVVNNLQDGTSYQNAYEVEKAAGLVKEK